MVQPANAAVVEAEDRLLTADEAAALLGVKPRWLYRRAARPSPPAHRGHRHPVGARGRVYSMIVLVTALPPTTHCPIHAPCRFNSASAWRL
jgi:hypothetical protein